jgi:adenylate cyclase
MDEMTRRPFQFEGYVLDVTRRSLSTGGREVELRPKSFAVLAYLVENAGRVVIKDEIMQTVWPDVTVADESLTRCVSDVRQALDDGTQKIIKTIPRRGYLFAAPVVRAGLGGYSDRPALAPLPNGEAVSSERAEQTGFPRWYLRLGAAAAITVLAVVAVAFMYWRTLASVAPTDRPSIAVLSFTVSSTDPDQGYLSEGLSEDLTTNLSRFGELFVVAHQSAKHFKDKPFDAGKIGRELGVRYLLTGSVRRDAARVRISAQLVNAATAHQLWAESYDREVAEFFAIQDEVTQRIVTTLVAHVAKSEYDRVLREKPDNIVAYESVLRANALTRGRPNNLAAIAEAKALYERALADDPRYARALQGLANVHFLAWAAEGAPEYQQQPVLDRALALAQQAVDLDGARAEAHATLGWILFFQNRFAEAVAQFEHAFRLNPNFVDGRYGMLLSHVGRAPEAIDYMKRAMRFDPFHPPSYTYWLGKGHYFNGNYDEAFGLIRSGAERQPGTLPPRVLLAAVAARLGRHDEARATAAEIMAMRPGFTIVDWLKFIRVVDRNYAERLMADLRKAGLPD